MKKIWKLVLITVVAAGILAATCPGKQRHTDEDDSPLPEFHK